MSPRLTAAFDAIVLDVFWNRLISICNEQAIALMRTSFTTIVRESEDLSAGVFDPAGNMIAQSVTGTPGHINSMATSMRHFLAQYPIPSLEPGDVLITNDPWFTSGQLHDLTIMTPVFRDGRVVAFFGNTCHAADIGGRGLSADAREVYEEGLYLPVLKLHRAGEPNEDVIRIIRGNVRSPDMVLGDIHAQISCNEVGGRRLLEFMDEFGLDSIEPLAEEILERSERAMRDAIERIPDGTYVGETWSDGFASEEPIHIVCAVTVKGSNLLVDYAGSSGQSRLGINVVLNYTTAYTTFGLKAAISPDVPNNEGSFRPVVVTWRRRRRRLHDPPAEHHDLFRQHRGAGRDRIWRLDEAGRDDGLAVGQGAAAIGPRRQARRGSKEHVVLRRRHAQPGSSAAAEGDGLDQEHGVAVKESLES